MSSPGDEVFWSNELAYIVGLIVTDGSLSKDKRHICITSTDYDLLETSLTCLKKTTKISLNPPSKLSKRQAYRLQIGDVHLYRWLETIGIYPNKSLTVGEIIIPDKFFADFLRGHLDGDGSIIHYTDRYMVQKSPKYVYDRLFVYFRSASKAHIMWLRDVIFRLKFIKGSLNEVLSKTQKGTHPIYVLKFSTKQARIVLNWMYYCSNLPYLKRKFNIAQPYLTF